MFSLDIVIAISLVCAVIGVAIGVVIARSWVPPEQQKALENRLSSAKQELDSYQQEVSKHFIETSRYVSELTQSYRELHEHLSKGALNLTSSDIGRQMLAAGDQEHEVNIEPSKVEPPKDWAPPRNTLREDFGLNESDDSLPPTDAAQGSGDKSK